MDSSWRIVPTGESGSGAWVAGPLLGHMGSQRADGLHTTIGSAFQSTGAAGGGQSYLVIFLA